MSNQELDLKIDAMLMELSGSTRHTNYAVSLPHKRSMLKQLEVMIDEEMAKTLSSTPNR